MGSIQQVREACGAEWRWRRRKVEVCREQGREEMRIREENMDGEDDEAEKMWVEENKRKKREESRIRKNEED